MIAKVRDVMTDEVRTVRRDATVAEIAALLRQDRSNALPVVDENRKVVGVVSETDLLAIQAPSGGHVAIEDILHYRGCKRAAADFTAGDLMTHPAVTVRPEYTVQDAARLMYVLRVNRLPVTDAGGHLAGVVSRADLLSVFDRSDEEIRAEVVREVIMGEFRLDPALFTVAVADGVVTVTGTPQAVDVGHDLVTRIRHVAGVVAVRDELACPLPVPAGLHF